MNLPGTVGWITNLYSWHPLLVAFIFWLVDYPAINSLARLQFGCWMHSGWRSIKYGNAFILPWVAFCEVKGLAYFQADQHPGAWYLSGRWFAAMLGLGWTIAIVRTILNWRNPNFPRAQIKAWWNIYHELIDWGPLFALYVFPFWALMFHTRAPGWITFTGGLIFAVFVRTFMLDVRDIKAGILPHRDQVF